MNQLKQLKQGIIHQRELLTKRTETHNGVEMLIVDNRLEWRKKMEKL